MQLMNRKSLCATFDVYCKGQLEFIRLECYSCSSAALYSMCYLVFLLLLISFSVQSELSE